MKILLINDPGIPVPPKLYGGIERIVFQLANDYRKLGHEVVLLAGPESNCDGKTINFGINSLQKSRWQVFKEVFFVWQYLIFNHRKFDVVHSFGRLIYLLPILNKPIRKIMSYQREVTVKNIQRIHKLPHRNLDFTGCSDYISKKEGLVGNWHTVYNFVDVNQYIFVEKVAEEAPFIFLGRIERIKGCHHCITLAKSTGKRLIIAGNISHLPNEKAYFEDEIKPHIDGVQIQYVGSVNDVQKNIYLGQSLALLMLIDWDEPFGIVMAEAMACGTPVIGFARGSVSELVYQNRTGFVANNISEAMMLVNMLVSLNRKDCRVSVEQQFDVGIISKKYLSLS